MTIGTVPEDDWVMVLRRQRSRAAGGKPRGGYGYAFEIICRDCGDDPGREYQDIPPRLQRIRGPYWIEAGVAEYEAHFAWHEALDRAPVTGATGRKLASFPVSA